MTILRSGWLPRNAASRDRVRLSVGANVVGVVVEEDVLDLGLELVFGAHGGGGHGDRGRRVNGYSRGGICRSAFAPGHEVIGGSRGGSDRFDAGSWDVAEAVDGDGGGVSGAPGELNLITGRDDGRRGGELGDGRRRHDAGGAVSVGPSGAIFFLQPETATKTANSATGIRMLFRMFKGLLLPQIRVSLQRDLT
jgi:hypothetical protein